MRSCSISLLPLIVVLGLASPGAAAQAATSQSEPPLFKTEAREVVVDVVVTNGNSEPVIGLRAKDFAVMEDGKPVIVDFFEEHSARKLPDELKPLPMPPGVYTNVPPAPESDAVNVLLLDMLNTDQQDQTFVYRQIIDFLKTIQPGTKIAIFTLSNRLRMVQGFTTDTSILRNALNDPKFGFWPTKSNASHSLSDKVDDLEQQTRLADLQMGAAGLEALASLQQGFNAYQADQRTAMTLEALNYLGRYLAGVPGRKNLIWFSSSFPVTVFPSAKEKQALAQLSESRAALKKTEDLLTVSKVAVYPIGAEGMIVSHVCDPVIQSNGCYDVEGGNVSSRSGPAAPTGRQPDFMTPFANENAARADKIMAMEQLAASTGGKAFYNTNDLNAAMQHAIADGSNYYTLAYSPTNKKMDGSYRHIEINVTEGKYKLAYRRGYNADDSLAHDTKADPDPLHSLLTPGLPGSTQIIYAVRAVPAVPQPAQNAPRAGKNAKLTGPTRRYGLDFLIRWSDVRLEQASDGNHTGKLRVELLAFDRDGLAVNWVGGTEIMDLTPDSYAAIQKSGIRAHFDIDVPATSEVLLETGVYDAETGKAGTLEIPLHPGPGANSASSATPSPGRK